MNKKLKISQIQFEAQSTPHENKILLEKYYKICLSFKPDLICTPECSNIITNDLNHLFKHANFQNNCPILNMSKIFARKNKVNINIGSLLLKKKNSIKLINRSFFIDAEGRIKSYYHKIHMFDVNISKNESHKESNSFIAGNKIKLSNIKAIKIGLSICYDLRFPNLFRLLTIKGAKIILMPAAFTVPTGKAHWETLIKARAIENSVFIIATNMCGTHHTNRKTYGYSAIVDPWGKLINKAKNKPKILNTIIDLNEIDKSRNKIPFISNDKF